MPTTVYVRSPFTVTLRCIDGGGGSIEAYLEIRTSVDNASLDSNVFTGAATDDGDFDVFEGPKSIGADAGVAPGIEHVGFAAVSPSGQLLQGYGYVGSKLNGAGNCVAQLTFLG